MLSLSALSGFLIPLGFVPWTAYGDWSYFNSLSLLVRSSALHYRVLPLQDPWCMGGLNLLANPQSRLFSPMLLLDLFLKPYHANLLSLVIYGLAGAWGAYLLFRRHSSSSRLGASAGAALFVNGTFFSLHFAEGHIPFGSLLLLPWVLLAFLEIERRGRLAFLAAITGLFFLDGGVYSGIFSALFLLSATAAGLKSPREWVSALLSKPKAGALSLVGFLFLSIPKIFPVLYEIGRRKFPQLDAQALTVPELIHSWFWPWQTQDFPFGATGYLFHEFGCYFSPIAIALLVLSRACERNRFEAVDRLNFRRCAGLLGFWLWVGSGWLPGVNPWRLFQKLPLINIAHVQSRLFVLAWLFFSILVASAISALQRDERHRTWLKGAVAALLLEGIVAHNLPFIPLRPQAGSADLFGKPIQSTTLRETRVRMEKPELYLTPDVAAKVCYEPSVLESPVRAVGDADYRGEAYALKGYASVRIKRYVPGDLRLDVNAPSGATLEINTRDLGSWRIDPKAESRGARILSRKNERLQLLVPPTKGSQSIRMNFLPNYLPWILASWILGASILGAQLLRALRRKVG